MADDWPLEGELEFAIDRISGRHNRRFWAGRQCPPYMTDVFSVGIVSAVLCTRMFLRRERVFEPYTLAVGVSDKDFGHTSGAL